MRIKSLNLFPLRKAMRVLAVATAFSAFFASSPVFGQNEDLGPPPSPKSSVTGSIYTNHTDRPVPYEVLRFRDAQSGQIFFTETRSDGAFTVALPPGHYSLELQRGQKFPASIVVGSNATQLGRLTTPLSGEELSPELRSEMESGKLPPGVKTNVTGTLVTYHGDPSPNHQIHFENIVSKDIFLLHTKPDGSFSIYLPRGTYDARLERGAKLGKPITVADNPVDAGRLVIPAPFYLPRLFQLQGFGEAIVKTPAPSTANVTPSRGAPLHGAGMPPLKTSDAQPSTQQQSASK